MEIINKVLLIYYFNILMISLIILLVLIAYANKMKSIIVNTAERSTPDSKYFKFPPTVKYVVLFGLIFFTVREYGGDVLKYAKQAFEYISELING